MGVDNAVKRVAPQLGWYHKHAALTGEGALSSLLAIRRICPDTPQRFRLNTRHGRCADCRTRFARIMVIDRVR